LAESSLAGLQSMTTMPRYGREDRAMRCRFRSLGNGRSIEVYRWHRAVFTRI